MFIPYRCIDKYFWILVLSYQILCSVECCKHDWNDRCLNHDKSRVLNSFCCVINSEIDVTG
jgi:hypothetical protein